MCVVFRMHTQCQCMTSWGEGHPVKTHMTSWAEGHEVKRADEYQVLFQVAAISIGNFLDKFILSSDEVFVFFLLQKSLLFFQQLHIFTYKHIIIRFSSTSVSFARVNVINRIDASILAHRWVSALAMGLRLSCNNPLIFRQRCIWKIYVYFNVFKKYCFLAPQ